MLRDVIVHLANDQPLLADLFALPQPSDSSLVCTNLRTLSGKTPSFVARGDATFLFPLDHVRFVEVPQQSIDDARLEAEQEAADAAARAAEASGPSASETLAMADETSPLLLPPPGAAKGAESGPLPADDRLAERGEDVAAGLRELASIAATFAELAERPVGNASDAPDAAPTIAWPDADVPAAGSKVASSPRRDEDAYTAELLRKIREA